MDVVLCDPGLRNDLTQKGKYDLMTLLHAAQMLTFSLTINKSIYKQSLRVVRASAIKSAQSPVSTSFSTKVFLLKQESRTLMSTARDVSNQSDISKLRVEDDGSFRRKPSTFRNTVEKGGKHEPEAGMFDGPLMIKRYYQDVELPT